MDVRPVLVFVPGVALLGGLLDRLPPVSLKMVISLFALILLGLGWVNYDIWKEYDDQIQPVKAHMEAARRHLKRTTDTRRGLLAEGELHEAARKLERVILPYTSLFSIPAVHEEIEEDHEDTGINIKLIRDLQITPLLFSQRLESKVRSDPSLISLTNHPPVEVLEGVTDDDRDPRGIFIRRRPLSHYRIPRPLSAYAAAKRIALYAGSAPLVRVIMQEAILSDLKRGRVAFEVDLARGMGTPLDLQIYGDVKRIAGYVGDRAKLFSPDGLTDKLKSGDATLYFFNLEARGVPQNMARILDLLARYPKVRAVVAVYTSRARKELADAAPGFKLLSVKRQRWGRAFAFLRKRTSPDYVRAVTQNDHLRASIGDPLLVSLLVDYYRFSGKAPRSLGIVHARLLFNMLALGSHNYAPKQRVIGALAWEVYSTRDALTLERATRIISGLLYEEGEPQLEKSAALLDDLIANGVLRVRADTYVTFMDDSLLRLSAAKHLSTVPVARRAAFLLRHDEELTAFHAGLHPDVDALVSHMLRDYGRVDAALRQRGRHLDLLNPYVVVLRRAAIAARNGRPRPETVRRLEKILFELASHKLPAVARQALAALQALSTPGVRRWVLVKLEQLAPLDEQLLGFTASATEEIYVDAVAAWLRDVCTAADPRKDARYNWGAKRIGTSDQWTRTRGRLTAGTNRAIWWALDTLAQVGTPAAVRTLVRFATPAEDARFSDAMWARIRYHAVSTLLWNGHTAQATGFLREVERSPRQWSELILMLYRLNDAKTAELLVRILSRQVKWSKAVARYKEHAALALALMDRAVANKAMAAILSGAFTGKSKVDSRAHAALALGYRGGADDYKQVAALVRQVAGKEISRYKQTAERRAFVKNLGKAVALFGTADALKLFKELSKNAGWNALDRGLSYRLHRFRAAGGERFVARRLLCESKSRAGRVLISQLGRMRTRTARTELNAIISILEGADGGDHIRRLCGDSASGVEARLKRWRKEDLHTFVDALSQEHVPADLPRFARWATHSSKRVRRMAIRALRRHRDPAAGRAVYRSIKAFGDPRGDGIHALGQQKNKANEPHLLEQLATGNKRNRGTIIKALGRCGGQKALLALLPLQTERLHGKGAARAALEIARRQRGRELSVVPILEALGGLAK